MASKETPLYAVYRYLADRREMRQRLTRVRGGSDLDRKRRAFYGQFIEPGDLVFDVGANIGNRTKIFAALGATVVAFEPHPGCAATLESLFAKSPQVHIEQKALGADDGGAELMTNVDHSLSSVSQPWIKAVKASGRFAGYRWKHRHTVAVATLDNMIAQYGLPIFLKVDVEGFEAHVMSGLSFPVRTLSFEYTPEFLEGAFSCLERLGEIGDYEFQVSLGETMAFELPTWVDEAMIRAKLPKLPDRTAGDVYARLISRP